MVGGRERGGGHSEWEERCRVGRQCFRKAQQRIGYKFGTETLSRKKQALSHALSSFGLVWAPSLSLPRYEKLLRNENLGVALFMVLQVSSIINMLFFVRCILFKYLCLLYEAVCI